MIYKNTKYEIFQDGSCFSYYTNKFLTPQMSNRYPTYNLTIEGQKKKVYVHRMVAETFLPAVPGKTCVNHKDGNTHNFHVSNLEWVTSKENAQHARENGLKPISDQTKNIYKENLEGEEWIPIPNYPNYVISNLGRIMNINTKRLLKQGITAHGYNEVNLWNHNKGKTCQVHRLVYMSFVGDIEKDLVINHKDGIKTNNRLDNLEKITRKENNLHAVYEIKTHKQAKPIAQLTKDNEKIKVYPSIAQAQRETGISNISRAIKNKRTAGGYYWRFI